MPNIKPGTWNQVNARPLTQNLFRTTFSRTIAANGVDPAFFTPIGPLGAGIGYSQSGGNLVLTSGVTANSELILRSTVSFSSDIEMRWQSILSQRIVNQSFVVELVDVIGDNVRLTVNSATSVTVTFGPGENPFTAANIGQSLSIGAINGVAGVPGRYAIAAVSGDTVTFTVAGWPASGSGTCSLFGWNFVRCVYSGATATTMNFDTQRNGYNSGDTAATINTTASPGHLGIVQVTSGFSTLLDQLIASAATLPTVVRATRVVNLPTEDANLVLQLRVVNGSVAPASTTTWTVGMTAVYDFRTANVTINDIRPQGPSAALPVALASALPAGTAVIGNVGGQAAHDAVLAGNPVRIGARALNAAYATVATGDQADLVSTLQGVLVTRPWQIPELEWSYAAAQNGIVNTTTAVTFRAAAGAGLRSYVTGVQVMAEALTTATELAIRDGAGGTVLWRTKIPTGGLPTMNIVFNNPLKSTANTLLEVVTLTASGAGAVYFNAQGFTAA
jgi:hypothetical protein